MASDHGEIRHRGEQVLGTFCTLLGLLLAIMSNWIGGAEFVASMVMASVLLLVLRSWQLWRATE